MSICQSVGRRCRSPHRALHCAKAIQGWEERISNKLPMKCQPAGPGAAEPGRLCLTATTNPSRMEARRMCPTLTEKDIAEVKYPFDCLGTSGNARQTGGREADLRTQPVPGCQTGLLICPGSSGLSVHESQDTDTCFIVSTLLGGSDGSEIKQFQVFWRTTGTRSDLAILPPIMSISVAAKVGLAPVLRHHLYEVA